MKIGHTLFERVFEKCDKGQLRRKSGAATPILVFSIFATFALIGATIDVSRALSTKVVIQAVVDAAALAGARDRDATEASIEATARALAEQNLALNAVGPMMSFDATLDAVNDQVRVAGSIPSPFNFAGMLGIDFLEIRAEALVQRAVPPLRVSVVLDNTGSMNFNGGIEALRTAATLLVDTLFANAEPADDLLVGIVPYVTTVNIRNEDFDMSWMDVNGLSAVHGLSFNETVAQVNHFDLFNVLGGMNPLAAWKGCVEARTSPYDITAEPPNPGNPNTLFVPYFWPDEPDAPDPLNSNSAWRNPLNSNLRANYTNDFFDLGPPNTLDSGYLQNAFLQGTGSTIQNQRQAILRDASRILNPANHPQIAATLRIDDDPFSNPHLLYETPANMRQDLLTVGPNQSCPTAVTPLTNDADRLRAEIAQMIGWNGSGTNSAIGLNWGWMQLTPEAPFPVAPPLNPGSELQRIIIIMTDGDNIFASHGNVTPNGSPYSGYGYVNQGRLGTTSVSNVAARLNERLQDVCDGAKDDGVMIWTVTFAANSNIQNEFRNCASTPQQHLNAPSPDALIDAFGEIARQIQFLRIAQ